MALRKYPAEIKGLVKANIELPVEELLDMIEESFKIRPPKQYIHSVKHTLRKEAGEPPRRTSSRVSAALHDRVAAALTEPASPSKEDMLESIELALDLVQRVGLNKALDYLEIADKLLVE